MASFFMAQTLTRERGFRAGLMARPETLIATPMSLQGLQMVNPLALELERVQAVIF